MKILVVDDHPLIREAMQHVLADLDDNVVLQGAGDIEAALLVLDGEPDIDLVLLDLSLPGVSGMAALEILRERHPATPVVVLSASDDQSTVVNTLDRGAMGFIPKCSANRLILNALRLVMAGGVYVPPQAVGGTGQPVRPQASSIGDLGLTGRQAEVLALMVQGKPNKVICRELNLAEGTVKIHVTAILKALNVANRTQAVIAANRLGLSATPITEG